MRGLAWAGLIGLTVVLQGCGLLTCNHEVAARCPPTRVWEDLTTSGRGWTYNEFPSAKTKQAAANMRAQFNVDSSLDQCYIFYDMEFVFRAYWYTERRDSENQREYQWRLVEFTHDGKTTGTNGGGGGILGPDDPEYWLNKVGFP